MLFIMRGTSCSGKGTFVKQHFAPHCVLSSDWYRQVLTNDVENQQQNGLVFDKIRDILEIRLKNRVPYTVIDATNLRMKSVKEFLDLAEKFGEKVTVISIAPPSVDELAVRSSKRAAEGGLYVPREVLERHHDSYFNSLANFQVCDKFHFVEIDQKHNIIFGKSL